MEGRRQLLFLRGARNVGHERDRWELGLWGAGLPGVGLRFDGRAAGALRVTNLWAMARRSWRIAGVRCWRRTRSTRLAWLGLRSGQAKDAVVSEVVVGGVVEVGILGEEGGAVPFDSPADADSLRAGCCGRCG